MWINAFFVVSKGIDKKICPKGYVIWICKGTGGHVNGWIALGFSCGLGALVALAGIPVRIPPEPPPLLTYASPTERRSNFSYTCRPQSLL